MLVFEDGGKFPELKESGWMQADRKARECRFSGSVQKETQTP